MFKLYFEDVLLIMGNINNEVPQLCITLFIVNAYYYIVVIEVVISFFLG